MPQITPVVSATTNINSTTAIGSVYSGDSTFPVKLVGGSDIVNGTRYLILWNVTYGMNSTSARPEIYVTQDRSTPWARILVEGFATPTTVDLEPMRDSKGAGCFILDSDGTDLEFSYRCVNAGQELWLTGMSLLAIPLDQLTENEDYWYVQHGAVDGPEATALTTWTDVLTLNVTLDEAGDYLLLSSVETTCEDTVLEGSAVRLQIGGITQKMEYGEECEDSRDRTSWSYSDVHSFLSGANTIKIQGGSQKGVKLKGYARGRIILFKANRFDQLVRAATHSGSSINVTDEYPNSTALETIVYTPNQQEWIVVLSNVFGWRTTGGGSHVSQINKDSVKVAGYASDFNGSFTDLDRTDASVSHAEEITGPHTFTLEGSAAPTDVPAGVNANDTYFQHSSLIVWSMELVDPGGPTYSQQESETVTISEELTKHTIRTLSDSYSLSDAIAYVKNQEYFKELEDTVSFTDDINNPYQVTLSDTFQSLDLISAARIQGTHPRIGFHPIWNPNRLSQLRALAGYDGNGNQIGPGSTFWNELLNSIDNLDGGGVNSHEIWHIALAYLITQDISYASRAITNALNKISSGMNGIYITGSANDFRLVRDVMRDMCYVYDWCYDLLNSSQRQTFIDYCHNAIYCTWNDTVESRAIQDTKNWATSTPTQNYFENYLLATSLVGVAFKNDVTYPMTFTDEFSNTHTFDLLFNSQDTTAGVYTDPLSMFYAKLEDALTRPTGLSNGFNISAWLEGGAWLEGENYGRAAQRHLLEAIKLLKFSGETDYTQDARFHFPDWPIWQMHANNPGSGSQYQIGDGGSNPHVYVNGYNRHLMLMLVEILAGTIESEYAQWWLDNTIPTMSQMNISVMNPYDFYLYDPAKPSRDYRAAISTQYYAKGCGIVHTRSSWADDAITSYIISSDMVQNHTHREMGGIQISKGDPTSSRDVWQICDPQAFTTSSSEVNNTVYHNCIQVGAEKQRFRGSPIWVGETTGIIDKVDIVDGDYTYVQANQSDAYWEGAASTSHGDTKETDVAVREYFHILPGYIVAFDRVKMTSGRETTPVKAVWHYPYVAPIDLGSNMYRSTNDAGRAFHQIMLPDAATISVSKDVILSKGSDNAFTWRTETLRPTASEHKFLNSFEIVDSSVLNPTAVVMVTSLGDEMVGVHFQNDLAVLFSKDVNGTTPASAFTYSVNYTGSAQKHYLANLTANGFYSVALDDVGGVANIIVSPGGPMQASDQGILQFSTDALYLTLPVIPGAEGYGSTTSAGRGGTVYRVTNLANSGTGSLADAIAQHNAASVPGVIIFETSGLLNLPSKLQVTNPFLTIAGQTAPAPGIVIKGSGIDVLADDVMIQHLRIRPGDVLADSTIDAIKVDANNVYVDHCSFTWAMNSNVNIASGSSNVAFNRCIASEALNAAWNAYNISIANNCSSISFQQCLISQAVGGWPTIEGGSSVAFINNALHETIDNFIVATDSGTYGPIQATFAGNTAATGMNEFVAGHGKLVEIDASVDATSQLYATDNIWPVGDTPDADAFQNNAPASVIVTGSPIDISGFTTIAATAISGNLISGVGAWPGYRDIADDRNVTQYQVSPLFGFIIDSQTVHGGWGNIAVNTTTHTLPSNPSGDDDGDGYTNLEEWLHAFSALAETEPPNYLVSEVEVLTPSEELTKNITKVFEDSFSPYDATNRAADTTREFSETITLTDSVVATVGNTYYVSILGDDTTGDGSNSLPWRTIQKAADNVAAGDTVLVGTGTYAGVDIQISGQQNAPITFLGDGAVIVNSANQRTPDNINIEGANYVVIDNFNVTGAPRIGIRVVVATGIVVKNCTVDNSQLTAILTGWTPDIQIFDNICTGSIDEHGIYVSNSNTSSDNCVVKNNECFSNNKNGIQFNGDCDAGGDGTLQFCTINSNYVHDNGWKGLSIISMSDSIITNNIVVNNGVNGAGAGGIHLTDQPGCAQPSNNNNVSNNTVVEFNITGIRTSDNAGNNVIFNNIVIANVGDNVVDEDGLNLIDPASNFISASTTNVFENFAGENFALIPGSPARGIGVNAYGGEQSSGVDYLGNPRPQGESDPGAIEAAAESTWIVDVTDTFTVTDGGVLKAPGVVRSDSAVITDAILRGVTSLRRDTTTITDAIQIIKSIAKAATDSATGSDSIALGITKVLEDFTYTHDVLSSPSFSHEVKILEDTANLTDEVQKILSRAFYDTATGTDAAFGTRHLFPPDQEDTLTASDDIEIAITKNLEDTVVYADVANKGTGKGLEDSTSMGDDITRVSIPGGGELVDTVTFIDLVEKNVVKAPDVSTINSILMNADRVNTVYRYGVKKPTPIIIESVTMSLPAEGINPEGIWTGQTSPPFMLRLKGGSGLSLNTEDYDLFFKMEVRSTGVDVIPKSPVALSFDDATGDPILSYEWQAGDTDTPGTYVAQFIIIRKRDGYPMLLDKRITRIYPNL